MNKITKIRILCLMMLVVIGVCRLSLAADMIPDKKIAALKDELPAGGKRMSSVRKRRAYKSAVSDGESLLKRYSDAPNRFEVLGVMLKSQRLLLALDPSSRNRKELIEICKQVSAAPAEYAAIRLDADMMLMDERMTRKNADFKQREEALVGIIKRYRGTAAEVTSLKIGALIAPKIGSLKLEADIARTMDERFADNFGLIEWRRKKIGLTRSEMVFVGEFERADGVKIKFPFDRMGHDCLMVFWSKDRPGYKDYLAKVNEMGQKYPDQFEIYSFNVDQLDDYGESILKELGYDFNAMNLPGGRKSRIYKFYGRMDPNVLLFNGYGRTVLTLNYTNGLDTYKRIKQIIAHQRVSYNRPLKRLQSLFIGDFLVVGLDGSIDPALPPELKMVSFKNDNANAPKLTRTADSVPAETLKAIQACFTPGVLRFRMKSADVLANYTKAEKLCSAAIKQHPNAPDLWIVRNRRIIALLGMWNLLGEPKYSQLAADEANIALKAKLPPAAMIVPRFCLVKHAIRQVDTVKAETLVLEMLKDMGGEDAPASVYAAASILALDAYSRDLYGQCRDKFMDDSYNGNPELWSYVSFLRNRFYQYGLLQSNYMRHEYKGRQSTRGYIVNHGTEPITDKFPKIELKYLDATAWKEPLPEGTVEIGNHSFETPSRFNGYPGEWSNQMSGVRNALATGGFGYAAPDGSNIIFAHHGKQRTSQVLTEKLAPHTTYTLKMDFLRRKDKEGPIKSMLALGYGAAGPRTGTQLAKIVSGASGAPIPGKPGEITTWTLTFKTGESPAGLGEPLWIELGADGSSDYGSSGYDNIRLTAIQQLPAGSVETKTADTVAKDDEDKLTLLMFVQPPADPNSDFPVILDGRGNPTKQDLIRSAMESASKLADSHVNKEVNLVLAFLCDDAKRVESLMKKNEWNCQAAIVPGGLTNPMVQRLGILSADRMPNIFLLRRDGTVAWHVSGFVYKDTFGYPFAALLGMKVHIEVCDTQLAYKALLDGDYKNAARIFAGPFTLRPPHRFGWLSPRHHGRTLALMGMKDWDAALESVETAIDAETIERHANIYKRKLNAEWRKDAIGVKVDRPCEVLAELWTLKAIILDNLDRTKEAQAQRKKAAGPITPHARSLNSTINGLSTVQAATKIASPYTRFHHKLIEFRKKNYK